MSRETAITWVLQCVPLLSLKVSIAEFSWGRFAWVSVITPKDIMHPSTVAEKTKLEGNMLKSSVIAKV